VSICPSVTSHSSTETTNTDSPLRLKFSDTENIIEVAMKSSQRGAEAKYEVITSDFWTNTSIYLRNSARYGYCYYVRLTESNLFALCRLMLSPVTLTDSLTSPKPFVSPILSSYMVLSAHPSHPSNGISIGSAIFAGLMNVTNRQTQTHTDRSRYSVCSNGPHLLLLRCGVIKNACISLLEAMIQMAKSDQNKHQFCCKLVCTTFVSTATFVAENNVSKGVSMEYSNVAQLLAC